MAGLSQTHICHLAALLANAVLTEGFAGLHGLTSVVRWKQKWITEHPEQPEGCLVFPSSKVSAFLSHLLEECTNNNSKDSLGAIKSARKALRHLRGCQAGIPDDGTEFPSQPYIAGVTSRAKIATTDARQRLVLVGKAKLVPLNSREHIVLSTICS